MNKIIEFINMQIAFFMGEIDYIEYSKFFRRKDNIIIQFTILFIFLVVMGTIYDIPMYMIIWSTIIMIYGFLMQTKATTLKQQMLYSFIWATTSFLISVIMLFLAVEVFGYFK
ncbi:hypothetical protein FQB35_11780 [Crassaminicella thermophila]|uniref:Uncharacterized protein n=1 Tax=Crassaminicella thermophila TaxID=2599308 RepID=A0A5C0SF35_CRATE|nr:hypothetical protein [Crassaminicella thermophila]QEK12951.1 hypothetical protein FQB35_11780 [Crassaminicella thermophila]